MRVLMVEDELMVARRLERFLRQILGSRLERLEIQSHLGEAVDRIFEMPYDLVFLDLNLNGEDGFELLRHAVSRSFHTIVVSAHTERALEAFELGVLDFVPKPFTRERLEQSIDRLTGQGQEARRVRYLAVRRTGDIHLVAIEDLKLIRASDDYAELHTLAGEVLLHDKTLTQLEALLPERFLRIHRSFLVDLQHAERLKTEPGSRYVLVLRDGSELPVGRTRVGALRRRLI